MCIPFQETGRETMRHISHLSLLHLFCRSGYRDNTIPFAAYSEHFPHNYECINLASSQTFSMLAVAEKVKSIYEKMVGKEIQLFVTGSEPVHANIFEVRLNKLVEKGFTENNDFTLESEIEQLFYYLQSKNNK